VLPTTDERSRAAAAQAAEQMRGQRLRFRVAPDGTVSMVASNDGGSREVAQVVSLMPAAFPKGPIKVGESWIREMPLPVGSQLGAQLSGKLHVTFRLDSLTHNHEWAFVSMRGEVQPATGPGAAFGATLEKGYVNGTDARGSTPRLADRVVVQHRRELGDERSGRERHSVDAHADAHHAAHAHHGQALD
jgi:hypothetical protein